MDDVGDRGAEAVEDRPALEVPHVAGATVADVDLVGQPAQHRHPFGRGEGQDRSTLHRLVAQQDDRPGRDLAGQRAVVRRSEHLDRRGRGRQDGVERQEGGHHPLDGPVDVGPADLPPFEGVGQVQGPDHPGGHLDVEAGGQRGSGLAHPEHPVADDEALEAPLPP